MEFKVLVNYFRHDNLTMNYGVRLYRTRLFRDQLWRATARSKMVKIADRYATRNAAARGVAVFVFRFRVSGDP